MKAIYDAARDILYPKHRENATGVALGHNLNSYRVSLRNALTVFEHANRGHRHLLDKPELSLAHAGRLTGPYSAPTYRSMRAKLRDTTYALADVIIQDQPHPPVKALRTLMTTPDTQGWLAHYAQGKLYEMCMHCKKLGLDRDFYLMAQVDNGDTEVRLRLTVHSSLSRLEAQRDIGPFAVDVRTFAGVAQLLPQVRATLTQLLADAPHWPEFAPLDHKNLAHTCAD